MSVIELYTIGITVDKFHRVSPLMEVMLVLSFESVKRLSSGVGT